MTRFCLKHCLHITTHFIPTTGLTIRYKQQPFMDFTSSTLWSLVRLLIFHSSSLRPLLPQLLPQFYKLLFHVTYLQCFPSQILTAIHLFFCVLLPLPSSYFLNAQNIVFQPFLFPEKCCKTTHFPISMTLGVIPQILTALKFSLVLFFSFSNDFVYTHVLFISTIIQSVQH